MSDAWFAQWVGPAPFPTLQKPSSRGKLKSRAKVRRDRARMDIKRREMGALALKQIEIDHNNRYSVSEPVYPAILSQFEVLVFRTEGFIRLCAAQFGYLYRLSSQNLAVAMRVSMVALQIRIHSWTDKRLRVPNVSTCGRVPNVENCLFGDLDLHLVYKIQNVPVICEAVEAFYPAYTDSYSSECILSTATTNVMSVYSEDVPCDMLLPFWYQGRCKLRLSEKIMDDIDKFPRIIITKVPHVRLRSYYWEKPGCNGNRIITSYHVEEKQMIVHEPPNIPADQLLMGYLLCAREDVDLDKHGWTEYAITWRSAFTRYACHNWTEISRPASVDRLGYLDDVEKSDVDGTG